MTRIIDIAEKEILSKLGVFWSGEWQVPENELFASVSAWDRITMLGQTEFYSSEVYKDKTLNELAEIVLLDAGVEEYQIDLSDTIIPYAYFEPVSHREALRIIVEAGLGRAYCNRDGVVIVERVAEEPVVANLTPNDYKSKNNPTNWQSVYNRIIVETQPLRPQPQEIVYEDLDPVSISGQQVKVIYFNKEPCINPVANLIGDGTITDEQWFSWGGSITIEGVGSYQLEVEAEPLEVVNRQRATRSDSISIQENGELTLRFGSNPLIQTLAQAQDMAEVLLATYKDSRRDVELDWRGDPRIKLGDKITVTDQYESSEYMITYNNLEYDGTLKEKTKGRKT
jgi:hypothetical protein